MALQSAGKAVMLAALDTATVTLKLYNSLGFVIDSETAAFTSSASGMVLSANVVFSVPAGAIVVSVTGAQSDDMNLFDATLSGTEAERTYTYAGTYTLTALTVTLS